VSNETDKVDRLAGRQLRGAITPETLPLLIAALAASLRQALDAEAAVDGEAGKSSHPASSCPLAGRHDPDSAPCRGMHGAQGPTAPTPTTDDPCAVCALLDFEEADWRRLIDLYIHCRALREFADHAASSAHTSHVAAIIVTPRLRLVDCDHRGESFLKAANILGIRGGQLFCTETSFQPNLISAIDEVAATGRSMNILLHAPKHPDQRFSLTLTRMEHRPAAANGDQPTKARDVLCLVAPLDGRRIATARQLMDLFGLSRAEARLARALCHGDSVKEYALDQGLLLPTVRTQLSAILHKTGTERQATLVRLIAGIPVVRDAV
jgi:DNA-binding CsgD family transcriptional regulator